jgi:hypothetical protein
LHPKLKRTENVTFLKKKENEKVCTLYMYDSLLRSERQRAGSNQI